MEAKMEKIEANVVKFEVRVEAEKFTAALNKAFNKNKNKFNIPGFRKGKVSLAMVKKFYGLEVLFDDAVNVVINETYPTVLDENNIRPVDFPSIDVLEVGEGKDLVYTATVTVYPEITLGEYKGLDVKKPSYEVSEEEIDNQIKAMQEKSARVVEKTEGTVVTGDVAVIDFKGFIGDEAFEGGEGTDYPLEIGSGSFIGNFEEQLVGMAKGDSKDVVVTFPENYGKEDLNGKEAKFEVTVKEIKVKELPEVDDEFASEVSEFDSLEALKADMREKLATANEEKANREFEDALVSAVIENSTMEIPSVMVEKEIDSMVADLENRLKYQGLTLEQYMEFTGNDEAKMRSYMKENAEKKVKGELVINAIAKAEDLKISDEEVNEKALELAKMYTGEDKAEEMAKMLATTQRAMIEKEMIVVKAIKLLEDNCK
ncbi:trigger factor [uncultured Clostridium sp.]|uniref:trigger factor n=1 Tax=uncultured Clostridium sp. TaxID=59620 RepID=UPI00262277AA|nr:trigger factor [uncultured Clostridium sp.]